MIINTCPECGYDLLGEVLDCIPPIHRCYCPSCGWSYSAQEEVVRIPFGGKSLKMRDIALEEVQSVENYIGSIPVQAGININDSYDDFDTTSSCNICINHPKNDGNGICNCVLASETLINTSKR